MTDSKIISPIAIDLGGLYTGLYMAQYPYGESLAQHHGKLTTLVMPEEGGKMTWSQAARTATRHRIRSNKRRKLAKRLLKVIFTQGLSYKLNDAELEALNGLLNRRGYNRVETDIDRQPLETVPPSWIANEFPEFFDSSSPISEQLEELLEDIPKLRDLAADEKFNLNNREAKKQLFTDAEDEQADILKAYGILRESVTELLNSIDFGHQHRRKYLEAVGKEILKDSRLAELRAKLGASALKNLIGNISNLQLRALRWYFNDTAMKSADYYDGERFKSVYVRWLQNWHVDEETRVNRNNALKVIHPSEDILTALMTIDAELTIPPYENQNNRRPPKDQTLWLNPQSLNEQYGSQWRVWVNNLRKRNPELAEGIAPVLEFTDRRSRLKTNKQRLTDTSLYADSYFLQRLLDRSRIHDTYALRAISKNFKSEKLEKFRWNLKQDLGDQHTEKFLDFTQKYYQEVERAKSGIWEQESASLLEKADINPPSKRKILNRLVGNILGVEMSAEELTTFLSDVWTKKVHGPSTVKSICKAAEDLRKQNGNLFNMYIQSVRYRASVEAGAEKKFKGLDKEIWQLLVKVEKAADVISGSISATETQKQRFSNTFSLAQLYTLIETDRNGFSKVSAAAHMELAWRMTMIPVDDKEAARCSRLPADSSRPFDGVLRRLLERQAYEIATLKSGQIKESGVRDSEISIPVVVEENRFTFSIGLADVKKDGSKRKKLLSLGEKQLEKWQEKNERIRQGGSGLCPYKGTILDKDAELDHIIPRSYSRDASGTIFNSEANLIYASRRGNQEKKDQRYGISDLAPNYLKAVYGTSDSAEITRIIEASVASIKKDFLFSELEGDQQRDVRHALFLERDSKAFEKVFRRLATQQSARVNGTQAWLARKLISVLKSQLKSWLSETGNTIVFNLCKADAQQTSFVRTGLAVTKPETTKGERQGVGSHAIDAYCAFSVAAAEGMHETLAQGAGLMEDTEWLATALPVDVDVNWVKRLPLYRKSELSTRPIFKEGIYAESFLTTWISEKGIESGFSLGSNSVQWQGKDTRGLLELLAPFATKNLNVDTALASPRPVQLDISKEKAFKHFEMVAKAPHSEVDLHQADILDALRYCTAKKDISSRLIDVQKKTLKKPEEVLKAKDIYVKVDVDVKGLGKLKGKVTHPAIEQWKRLFLIPDIETRIGEKAVGINWQQIGEKYFGEGSSRPHSKTRRVYSLPIVDSPDGGYRIKRIAPDGSTIWQLTSIKDTGSSGFTVNDKGVNWKQPVAIPALRDSSVVGVGERYQPVPEQQVYFDDWKCVDITDERVLSVSVAPGTKDRRYVSVSQTLSDFKAWLTESGIKLHSPFEIPSRVKVDAAKFQSAHGIDVLGKPKSNLFISKVGDVVNYWYIRESSPVVINQYYDKALLAEREAVNETEPCDI
ncbi:type II-B CRISPR-associated RNA-guided endonuclease Cas9/Csx12 [uncultured Thalassolituus sp.]|uniref:type II-B CRISPR-associated RNA-guided endonuclease Cas9/Csx12 n=1 Tax=uncultured Thalassolituus sp. TaxID=285273 RepID=UPI00261D499C|nr:type II-B CRISPR-associated RNA-guided endonuclease Cas9/Csx12 [uncultured Thalassolituus sp.]